MKRDSNDHQKFQLKTKSFIKFIDYTYLRVRDH